MVPVSASCLFSIMHGGRHGFAISFLAVTSAATLKWRANTIAVALFIVYYACLGYTPPSVWGRAFLLVAHRRAKPMKPR